MIKRLEGIAEILKLKLSRKVAEPKKELEQIINLSEDLRIIFIHIPKNAGTSVSKTLGFEISSHHTALEIKEILGERYQNYFKFCFVRNPWDRFLSLYNYARLDESDYHSAVNPSKALYGKHLDYDLLKTASLRECAQYLVDGKLMHDTRWNHWLPQATWITDKFGNILVDHIGRVERIDEDFDLIAQKIGISRTIERMNVSDRKSRNPNHYRDFYDDETRDMIAKYYALDIKIFGYSF